jgi:serine/threonine protein kinase
VSRFINKYMVIKELGRGSFGEVYLVRNEESEKLYAMKSVSKYDSDTTTLTLPRRQPYIQLLVSCID